MPATRTIPDGKLLVAEYGTYDDAERAVVTVLATGYSPREKATVGMIHSTPGFERAGSRACWTNGYYAVKWTDARGNIQGRRYTQESKVEATKHFERLLKDHDPKVEKALDRKLAHCFCGWWELHDTQEAAEAAVAGHS